MLVCIDAGHAENTAGKRSFDGSLREYEFNRSVAKKLKYHLERHGVKTIFSCDLDTPVDISLAKRCAVANNAKADLLVSIHANAHTTKTANGWEIFHCKGSTEGAKLAEAIRKESISLLGLKDRGVKTDSLYMTKHTKMTAVLIEHGFYTNDKELALLKSDDFREKCALADARGILNYLGMKWIDEGEKLVTNETDKNFKVRVEISDLNIRKGPGTDYDVIRTIKPSVYTIIEVKSGKGSSSGWGRLKSRAGWISLDFVKRV